MPDWTLSQLRKSLDIHDLNPLFWVWPAGDPVVWGKTWSPAWPVLLTVTSHVSPSVWSTRGVQPTMQTLTDNSGLACTTWKYIALIFSHCRCELSLTHLLGCTFQTLKHPAVHFVQKWLLLHPVDVTIFDSTHPRTTRWKHSSLFFQGIDSKSLFTPDGRSGNA